MEDHFGEVYYSEYFNEYIVVVAYTNDDNWYFVRRGMKVILKAQSKLSKMGDYLAIDALYPWRAED